MWRWLGLSDVTGVGLDKGNPAVKIYLQCWEEKRGRGGAGIVRPVVKSNPSGGTVSHHVKRSTLHYGLGYTGIWLHIRGAEPPEKEWKKKRKILTGWYAVMKRQKKKRKADAVMLASVAPACTPRHTCSSVPPARWSRESNWQRRPTRSKEKSTHRRRKLKKCYVGLRWRGKP